MENICQSVIISGVVSIITPKNIFVGDNYVLAAQPTLQLIPIIILPMEVGVKCYVRNNDGDEETRTLKQRDFRKIVIINQTYGYVPNEQQIKKFEIAKDIGFKADIPAIEPAGTGYQEYPDLYQEENCVVFDFDI